MKRSGLIACGLLLLASTLSPSLTAQRTIEPYLGGGLALGTGDLKQDTGNGWMVFGGLDVPYPSIPALAIGAAGSFTEIPYGGGFGESMRVTTVSGDVSYTFGAESPSTFKPYLRGGVGLHVHSYDPGRIDTGSATDTRVGGTASIGVKVNVSGANLLLGGRFTSGMDAGFVGFFGGLSFPWVG